MADLSQEDWTELLNTDTNAVVLDVRTPEEVEQGMIPNAFHIDIHKGQGFIDEVSLLDKSKSYFIYCKSGGRSGQACAVLKHLGFEKAYNLLGGITEWQGEIV